MIDFVVVSSELRPHVLDTRVKRRPSCQLITWWCVGSDVGGRCRPDLGRPKFLVRGRWEGLAGSLVRKSFISELRQNFAHVPAEAGDIESEWIMFGASIVEVAGKVF